MSGIFIIPIQRSFHRFMNLSRYIQFSLILLVNCARADGGPTQLELLPKAIDILTHESVIVGKYTCGFVEERPTELAWAFSVIASSEDPQAHFSILAKRDSIYGLIGLKVVDTIAYQEVLQDFAGDETVCIVICDMFIEYSIEEFVLEILEESSKKIYNQLYFDKLPQWTDTVRVPSPCSWFE